MGKGSVGHQEFFSSGWGWGWGKKVWLQEGRGDEGKNISAAINRQFFQILLKRRFSQDILPKNRETVMNINFGRGSRKEAGKNHLEKRE